MLDTNEVNALIRLLDDPDENIYQQIKSKLLSFGNDIAIHLEDAKITTSDIIIRDRLDNIIHTLQIEYIYKQLEKWGKNDKNLLDAYILITKYQYPNLDEEKTTKLLNTIISDVWMEINDNLTALEKVKVINHIFFDIYGFQAVASINCTHYNLYINHLLNTKKGINLTLSILYVIIAQQLRIPIYGVNLPHHFILAYQSENETEKFLHNRDVLFYINIMNKGKVFPKREIDLYLQQLHIEPQKSYYHPCSNCDVISLLIDCLIWYYKDKHNKTELNKVKDLETFRKALK